MKVEAYCVYAAKKIPCDAECELYHGYCPYVGMKTNDNQTDAGSEC